MAARVRERASRGASHCKPHMVICNLLQMLQVKETCIDRRGNSKSICTTSELDASLPLDEEASSAAEDSLPVPS